MNLTKQQKELVNHIKEYSNDGYYYCECGKWKYWNVKTIKSAFTKGIVKFHPLSPSKDFNWSQAVYFLTE
tara:strand:+ start:767 stop:976 length:210 start_codon:yes stop_codon:yes gene_type:complete